MSYQLRMVEGLDAPANVVSNIKDNGVPDDIAWFYLLEDALEYIEFKNGSPQNRDYDGGDAQVVLPPG